MSSDPVSTASAVRQSVLNRLLRGLVPLFFIALVLIVSGCTGGADSVLEVTEDFAGERSITLTFDREELSKIEGGFPAIVNTARANCPAELDLSDVDDTKENPTIEFVMSFASFEDYADQLERILSAGGRQIQMDLGFEPPGDLPFVDKFSYHENISHRDLFDWLVRALYRENVVLTRPGVEPIADESMTIRMRGFEYDIERTADGFAVAEVQSFSPEVIDVYTGFQEDGNLRRIIQLTLPYDRHIAQERLDSWLDDQVNSGIDYRLEEDANGFKTILTFDFITADSDGLQLMSGQVFHDPSHLIQRRQQPVEQRTDQLAEYWNESFNLDFFYGRTDDKPLLRRFFDGHYLNPEATLPANEGRVKSALTYPILPQESNHPLVTDRRGEVTLIMDVPLRTLRLDTDITSSGTLRRTYEMGFDPRWFEYFAETLRKQLPDDVEITEEDPGTSTLTLQFATDNGARFANVNYQLLGWESLWYQGQRLMSYNGIITERPGEKPIRVSEPVAYQLNMPYKGRIAVTGLSEPGKTAAVIPKPDQERYDDATMRDTYSINKAFSKAVMKKAQSSEEEEDVPSYIGVEPNFNEKRLVLHSFRAESFDIYSDYTGSKWLILLIAGGIVGSVLLVVLIFAIRNRREHKRSEIRDFEKNVLYGDEAEQARLKGLFERGYGHDASEPPITRISWDDEPSRNKRDPFAPQDGDKSDY